MEGAPLTPDEFALYSLLHVSPRLTPAETADRLGVQRSTLSNYLKRMEERGHLARSRHPADGRSARLELSEPGHRVVHEVETTFKKAIQAIDANLVMGRPQLLEALVALNATLERAMKALARPS